MCKLIFCIEFVSNGKSLLQKITILSELRESNAQQTMKDKVLYLAAQKRLKLFFGLFSSVLR